MGCLQSLVSPGTATADGNDLAILDKYRGDALANKTASKDGWQRYDYQLENIAFSGGGVKGFAYIGAMQVGAPRKAAILVPTRTCPGSSHTVNVLQALFTLTL